MNGETDRRQTTQREDERSEMKLDASTTPGEVATVSVPYYQLKPLPPLPPRTFPFQPSSLLRNEMPLQLQGMASASGLPKIEAQAVMLRVPEDATVKEITM